MPSITFRDAVSGQVTDLLSDEGKICASTHALMIFLVGALLNYKEESVFYRPTVLICENINLIMNAFPGGAYYQIGELPLTPASGKQFLKECAPLSGPEWNLYVERADENTMRYGIFSYYRLPTAISIEEANSLNKSIFSVILKQTDSSTIEITGSKGGNLSVDFSTTRGKKTDTSGGLGDFCADICGKVTHEFKEQFQRYMTTVLDGALDASHGTMLVAIDTAEIELSPELTDVVRLNPPLDFLSAFQEYATSKSADAILGLQRNEALLRGVLSSDGIVVFDSLGCIIAYRAFYRPQQAQANQVKVVGGARRRAFEGTKTLVGISLTSVLFRSQDGDSIYYGNSNAGK